MTATLEKTTNHQFDAAAAAGRVPFKVRDLSLATLGRAEIRLAEHEMPGLTALREQYAGNRARRIDGVGLADCALAHAETHEGVLTLRRRRELRLDVDVEPFEYYLHDGEITALMSRRDRALEYIDSLIAAHGEQAVLAFP